MGYNGGITTMGGRAGGGARSAGGGTGARSAYDLGKGMMATTQADFDRANSFVAKGSQGGIGFSMKSSQLTDSAKSKLKANGWKPFRMETMQGKWFTQWESPTFHSLGELQSHAKSLMGKRK